nr:pyrethroid hydrolase ces2e [Quercus suber]
MDWIFAPLKIYTDRKMASFQQYFIVALLALRCAASPASRAVNPAVTISSGVVIGTATSVSNQPSVTDLAHAYLGIPFAQSPPLRFAPPSAPSAWSTPLIAQTLPPACLQRFVAASEKAFFNNPGLPPPAESEDCLYLNVFTPQNASSKDLKPVLFWLFGGNLEFGTASLAYYNGSSLAVNEDVIVVVPNYRTNFFGFSNSPQIPFGQQNSGFLDQRFALQWVQDNIKSFGGDPTKVTIFGESAGGYSVKQLLANPPSPLPFRAAIMESQGTVIVGDGAQSYQQVLANFSCANAPSPIDCLRKVPGADLLAYIDENEVEFPPVINDGTYIASDALPSITSGKFANVPILLGTNANEGRVFLEIAGLFNGQSTVDAVLSLTGLNISGIEQSLLARYAADIVNDGDVLIAQIVTDLIFTCPTQTLASAVQAAGRQPVWRYRFDGVFPDVSLFPNAGAYHTVEIPEVWGTYPLSNQYGNATANQIALSRYMQGAWASFAKQPSAGPGWPKLGSNFGIELGVLGGTKTPAGESTQSLLVADYPCPIYDPLNIATGRAF